MTQITICNIVAYCDFITYLCADIKWIQEANIEF